MIAFFLLAAALPALYTDQDISNAVKLTPPGVRYQMNVASATRSPWVDSNGWRIFRAGNRPVFYDVPAGGAALAAAEAHMFGANSVIKIAPADADAFKRMNGFLHRIDAARLPALANIAVTDDGSNPAAEGLNLLLRKNLLFRIVAAPDAKADLNLKADKSIQNPFDWAQEARYKLTDDRRLVRVYGSDVVLAHLTGDGKHARLYLLNYGRRGPEGLRVRVRGQYRRIELAAYDAENTRAEDVVTAPAATEFSVLRLPVYAVIDLWRE